MADVEIDAFLAERGFRTPEARRAARAVLEAAGLTNPRKSRLSDGKLGPAREALARELVRACGETVCAEAAARREGARAVTADPEDCEICGGSANARAAVRFSAACAGRRPRLVVVGGSPDVRRELARLIGRDAELRLVDGTGTMTADRARADVRWADLVVVAGASELSHKVSVPYRSAADGREKVIVVPKRGVAAIIDAATERLR
ncbi:MAG TPA: hypothetical protein VFM93_11545 [Candidatus Limnocylindria bacterium]|nr:hypothetical protein [Candidatus Limnocylindria bacterium]